MPKTKRVEPQIRTEEVARKTVQNPATVVQTPTPSKVSPTPAPIGDGMGNVVTPETAQLQGTTEAWLDPVQAAKLAATRPVFEVSDPNAPKGQSGADLFLKSLDALGVPYVPGNYGITEIGFTMAAEKNGPGVEPMLVMQEMVAAGMAHGHALATDEPLVSFAHGTLGFGAMSALVFNFKQDGIPGIFVLGNAGNLAGSMMQTQDADGLPGAIKMAEGAGAKRVFVASDPAAIPKLMSDAYELATSGKPGPVVVVIPDQDVMRKELPAGQEVAIHKPRRTEMSYPNPRDVDAMSQALAKAKNPLIVVGNELARNGPEAIKATEELAQKVGAKVFGLMENHLAFPRDNPLFVGQAGAVDGRSWPKEMREADAIIYLGTHTDQMAVFPGAEGPYNKDAQVFLVGTDPDLSVRAYEGKQVLASPGPTVQDILAKVDGQQDDAAKAAAAARVASISTETAAAKTRSTEAAYREASQMELHPVEFAEALAQALKGRDDVIVVNEGIGYAGLFENALAPSDPGKYFAGRGGALGIAGPVSSGIAAATDKTVIAISGDGAFNYTPQWIATARENGLNVIEIVLKNDEYRFLDVALDGIGKADGAALPRPQVHQLDRDRKTGQRLGFDYTKLAAAYDAPAISISKREDIPKAIDFITQQIGQPNPALVQLEIRHPAPA